MSGQYRATPLHRSPALWCGPGCQKAATSEPGGKIPATGTPRPDGTEIEERPLREEQWLMRAQYHFWPGDAGLDAWDVHRLIELSRELPVRQVEVASVPELDTVHWFDGTLQRPTVRKVIEHAQLIHEADLSHPIILGHDGRVMDGMHRVARALLEGHETIDAVQFETDPEPDYRGCRPEDLPYDDKP